MYQVAKLVGSRLASLFVSCPFTDGDFDSEDAHVRIKPEPLDNLCQMTKFTRKELQYMYRGFKQVSWHLFSSLASLSFHQRIRLT